LFNRECYRNGQKAGILKLIKFLKVMRKSDRFVVTPVIEMGVNRNERAVDVEMSGVDFDRKMSFAQWTR
jgi:hypothetical protein